MSLTFQDAAEMAEQAFFLTPEGEAVNDTIDLAIRTNGYQETPGTRALLLAEILILDKTTDNLVWPTYSDLIWTAANAAARSLEGK
jgi:hypothetical protein